MFFMTTALFLIVMDVNYLSNMLLCCICMTVLSIYLKLLFIFYSLGMEDEFDENEKRLKDFSELLDNLNRNMEGHLKVIEKRSSMYRDCQT